MTRMKRIDTDPIRFIRALSYPPPIGKRHTDTTTRRHEVNAGFVSSCLCVVVPESPGCIILIRTISTTPNDTEAGGTHGIDEST
jgi:hypothetical protein